MKHLGLFVLTAAFAVVLGLLVLSHPTSFRQSEAMGGYEDDLFARSNEVRAMYHVSPLAWDSQLTEVARERASDMASRGYFSHYSPTGQSAFRLLNARGYGYLIAGENIARNNYPNDQAVQVAMDAFGRSGTHLQNMIDPTFTNIGVGAATGAGNFKFFVIVFSEPRE